MTTSDSNQSNQCFEDAIELLNSVSGLLELRGCLDGSSFEQLTIGSIDRMEAAVKRVCPHLLSSEVVI